MLDNVLREVAKERERQDAKHGVQDQHPFKWLTILGEEYGEACRAAYEKEDSRYREELIQVAAVAVAMVECLDRRYYGD